MNEFPVSPSEVTLVDVKSFEELIQGIIITTNLPTLQSSKNFGKKLEQNLETETFTCILACQELSQAIRCLIRRVTERKRYIVETDEDDIYDVIPLGKSFSLTNISE